MENRVENSLNIESEIHDNSGYRDSDMCNNFEENSEYFASIPQELTLEEPSNESCSLEMEIHDNPRYMEPESNFEENTEYFRSEVYKGDLEKQVHHLDIKDNPVITNQEFQNSFEGNSEFYASKIRKMEDGTEYENNGRISVEPKERPKTKKVKLEKHVEYTFNTIGYVVGLGNIWRFSNLCYTYGGGAFLPIYTLFYIVIGLPLFLLELYMGQFTSRGCIECWGTCRILKGVGVGMLSLTVAIMFTYMMFMVWSLKYLVLSFFNPLPWSNTSIETSTDPLSANVFFMHGGFHVIESSGIGGLGLPQWEIVLAGFVAWLAIFLCIIKGMKFSGKAVYITVLLPYLTGLILIIQSVTLPGSGRGLMDYMSTKDFRHISNNNLWTDAAVQLLFSLSLAQGGLTCLSSFNDLRSNVLMSSVAVTLTDYLTSIYLGIIVFSYIGFVKYSLNLQINEFDWNGVTILFIIVPQAISETSVPRLWSILFFILLISLAFDVMLTFTRTVCISISEFFSQYRNVKDMYINLGCCTFGFITTIALSTSGGYYFFQLIKHYGDTWTTLLNAILTIVLIVALYGGRQVSIDIAYMLKEKPITSKIWKYAKYYFMTCWYFVTPIFLLYLLISKWINSQTPFTVLNKDYPGWSVMFGWMIALSIPCSILITWMVYFIKAKGSLRKRFNYMKNSNPGEPLWSIVTPVDREELKEIKRQIYAKDK